VVVALVDGELCAFASIKPARDRFSWHLLTMAAGSPRLDAHESEVVELWSSLLEFAVARAGEAKAKRLFADCAEGSLAHESLAHAGFEAFTTHTTLIAEIAESDNLTIPGVRPQEPSDAWSIHHLYHRLTPRLVQFAEARSSTSWELPRRSIKGRLPLASAGSKSFVFETIDGIEAHCHCERQGDGFRIDILVDPASALHSGEFVRHVSELAEIPVGSTLWTTVPGYARDVIGSLDEAGFRVYDERIAMVRHTTAPAKVHLRLAPLPSAESAERAVHGILTYSCSPRLVYKPTPEASHFLRASAGRWRYRRFTVDRTWKPAGVHGMEHSAS
jgi:hypothetical protein